MPDSEQPPKIPSDLARERAAREAVKEVVEQIAIWNEEIARLGAMVKGSYRRTEQRETLRSTLSALNFKIVEAEYGLNTQMPLDLQSHSRIADAHRSIAGLRRTIAELLAALDAP
jgi:hypothetical protein